MRAVLLSLIFLVASAYGVLELNPVYSNLDLSSPVDLRNDGTTDYLYVVQQAGVITIFDSADADASGSTFIDISARVDYGGEKGLLGLAFHPDYATNRYFYTYRTQTINSQLQTVVSRFTANADGLSAAIGTELVLLTYNQPYSNHNGGSINFGSDGYLYIALGDGGSGGDPQNQGQQTNTLLGKILRIDVNNPSGGKNYGIPATNPFAGGVGGLPEIFAYGLRNPWRTSFDSETGELWVGDVGQNIWEEVDVVSVGGNYGWRVMEGEVCYNAGSCNTAGKILPLHVYDHGVGQSITGGYVYRGTLAPEISGKYIFADYNVGIVWSMTFDPNDKYQNTVAQEFSGAFRPSAFGVDRCNELFMVSHNEGQLYKFSSADGTVSCPNPSASNIIQPLFSFVALLVILIALF